MDAYVHESLLALFFAVLGFAFGPWGIFLAIAIVILHRLWVTRGLPATKRAWVKFKAWLKGGL